MSHWMTSGSDRLKALKARKDSYGARAQKLAAIVAPEKMVLLDWPSSKRTARSSINEAKIRYPPFHPFAQRGIFVSVGNVPVIDRYRNDDFIRTNNASKVTTPMSYVHAVRKPRGKFYSGIPHRRRRTRYSSIGYQKPNENGFNGGPRKILSNYSKGTPNPSHNKTLLKSANPVNEVLQEHPQSFMENLSRNSVVESYYVAKNYMHWKPPPDREYNHQIPYGDLNVFPRNIAAPKSKGIKRFQKSAHCNSDSHPVTEIGCNNFGMHGNCVNGSRDGRLDVFPIKTSGPRSKGIKRFQTTQRRI